MEGVLGQFPGLVDVPLLELFSLDELGGGSGGMEGPDELGSGGSGGMEGSPSRIPMDELFGHNIPPEDTEPTLDIILGDQLSE